MPNSILAKRKNIGRDPYEVSLDTVRGFAKDIASLGFHILPWAKVPPAATCKIASIQQGKGFYRLDKARNSPGLALTTLKRGLYLTLLPLRGVRNGGNCRILAILHIARGGTLALGGLLALHETWLVPPL